MRGDVKVKKIKADIALHGNPISELRDVTCHMGSHKIRYFLIYCIKSERNDNFVMQSA